MFRWNDKEAYWVILDNFISLQLTSFTQIYFSIKFMLSMTLKVFKNLESNSLV